MKYIRTKFLLLVFMNIMGVNAYAYDTVIDGIYYNIYELSGSAAVTSFNSDPSVNSTAYIGMINIPQSVRYNGKEYMVRSIGSWAFYGCSNMLSITIPNSVTAIGNSAFSGCSSLTSITIPNNVKTIGENTF